jgi:Helicase HerA, central domain
LTHCPKGRTVALRRSVALTLGWQLTPGGDPAYWLSPKPRAGSQSDDDLVKVPAAAMGTHTVIVAQSGSGKSFFLGRLIEELVLQTRARCLILDPNADFWKVHEIEAPKLWTEAAYDAEKGIGKLPHESRRQDFASAWADVSKRILTARATSDETPYERLQVWWPDLSVELLAEDLDPIERSAVYHCHAFVKAIAPLVQLKGKRSRRYYDLIEVAEKLYRARDQFGGNREQLKTIIENEFPADNLWRSMTTKSEPGLLLTLFPFRSLRETEEETWSNLIDQAIIALSRSAGIGPYYFGKAGEYKAILARKPPPVRELSRLDVIDLPSLSTRNTRLLATNMILAQEWENARNAWVAALEKPSEEDPRVPTFIVVDEAHNLILADPQRGAEYALREQFRTIAAEGRKYGLFFILVSQRPDKLDPLVVSECENKALMRLDSQSVLDVVLRNFGLEDVRPRLLEKCLEFRMGRALLLGRWAGDNPRLCYCAARRTVEGGRNLRPEHWATPRRDHEDAARNGKRPTTSRGAKKRPVTKDQTSVSRSGGSSPEEVSGTQG